MRRQVLTLCCGVAVALGLAAASLPAAAQSVCPGRISANAFAPVPANTPITLSGRADSPGERQLSEAVLNALRQAGRRVDDNAPYQLSWRGGVSADRMGGGGGGYSDRMYSSLSGDDDLAWMHNVPRFGRREVPTMRVNGIVELRERASRRVVWTAVLSCEMQGNVDNGALFAQLAGAVVPLIGHSMAGRPF